jgi:hypothetical protein
MKNKEIKTILKFALFVLKASMIIWVTETLFFLIYEGWHIKATNPNEIWFDKCASNMWNVVLYCYVFCGIYSLCNLTKKK